MSGIDQLFDRFSDLVRSWVNSDSDFSAGGQTRTGDSYLDEATEELNAFLNNDKEKQERLRREREARTEDNTRRASGSANTSWAAQTALHAAYKTLGLANGAPFADVKTAYKRLLKAHHPDKHSNDPAAQKKATAMSAEINNAYTVIETWYTSGTVPH